MECDIVHLHYANVLWWHKTFALSGGPIISLARDTSAPPLARVITDYWMPTLDGAGLVAAIRAWLRTQIPGRPVFPLAFLRMPFLDGLVPGSGVIGRFGRKLGWPPANQSISRLLGLFYSPGHDVYLAPHRLRHDFQYGESPVVFMRTSNFSLPKSVPIYGFFTDRILGYFDVFRGVAWPKNKRRGLHKTRVFID